MHGYFVISHWISSYLILHSHLHVKATYNVKLWKYNMIWLHFWFLRAPASTMYKFSHSVYRVVSWEAILYFPAVLLSVIKAGHVGLFSYKKNKYIELGILFSCAKIADLISNWILFIWYSVFINRLIIWLVTKYIINKCLKVLAQSYRELINRNYYN